ncbi:hypothetical protein [Amycolatopsis sp. cmx-4-83]|uniref:hypothetical protein n=1 Tax=Amycolatopsis sp. cmx-4-83 TaxID=2790940 RepID=UPI00397963D7
MTTWFGDQPVPPRRLSGPAIKTLLRHELRDCGTRLESETLAVQPLLTSRTAYDELFAAASGLVRLVRRCVAESAPTRAGRLAALGMADGPFEPRDEDFESRYADVMARPDVVLGPDGPRFLEFNVSGTFGGPAEVRLFTGAWTRVYGEGTFFGHDPFSARAAMYKEVCTELGLPAAVRFLGSIRDRPGARTARYYEEEVEHFVAHSFDASFVEPEDLPVVPAGSLLHRYFAVDDWRDLGIDVGPVHDAVARGCVLFPPQSSYLLANKKVLAWLSEGTAWMSEPDRALVDRYLPWTRVVKPGPVLRGGVAHRDFADFALSHQDELVLKKAVGMMGLQVTLGPFTSESAWRDEVARALADGDTIVQDYVTPGRVPVEMTDETGDGTHVRSIAPVLSPILFGGQPAGCWARYRGTGEDGIIGASGHGATENVLLAVQ